MLSSSRDQREAEVRYASKNSIHLVVYTLQLNSIYLP